MGRIWDLIVSVPDHCLSFYFTKLGPVANNSENIATGRQSLGMCLGIFDPVGVNGTCQHIRLVGLNGVFYAFCRCFEL